MDSQLPSLTPRGRPSPGRVETRIWPSLVGGHFRAGPSHHVMMGVQSKAQPVRRTTNRCHDFPRCPTRPDQVWVADITYVRLRDEYAYPAVPMDVLTRVKLGWASGLNLDQGLT
jgi:transposase InsO family protein